MRSALMGVMALTVASGCGGGGISEEEAEVVYQAVNDVTTDVSGSATTAAYRAGAWQWEQTGNGYQFSGTLNGGILWTGVIEVTASYEMGGGTGGQSISYDFGMDLIDVEPTRHNVVMNGSIDMAMDYTVSGAGYSAVYETSAELDVTGADAAGHASMQYKMTIDVGAGGYSVTAEGDINGHDVSGFTYSGSY